MKMNWNPVDSQALILNLLQVFRPGDTLRISRNVVQEKGWNEQKKEYLFLCLSFAQTKKEHPEYCSTMDEICRSIISRQKSVDIKRVKKKEYREGFGWSNNVQLNRIEKGTAEMPSQQIQTLCSAFREESDRIFWSNQLYAFFSDTCYLPPQESMESELLFWLISNMSDAMREHAHKILPESDRRRFASCLECLNGDPDSSDRESSSKLGEPPYQLYPVIRRLCRIQKITVECLVEEELLTTLVSWYDWKGKWETAERYSFEYMPHPRLKKRHMKIMALVFELNYLETAAFLQIAGYRLGENEMDQKMVRYLLDDLENGRKSVGREIKRELQRM